MAFIRQQGINISQRPFCEEVPGGWLLRYHAQPVQPQGPEQTEPLDLSMATALAAAIIAKCSPRRGPRDYEDYEDYQADIDCNNYEIGREGVKKKHHVVSHQLHDETKRRRTVPDESGPEQATTLACPPNSFFAAGTCVVG